LEDIYNCPLIQIDDSHPGLLTCGLAFKSHPEDYMSDYMRGHTSYWDTLGISQQDYDKEMQLVREKPDRER